MMKETCLRCGAPSNADICPTCYHKDPGLSGADMRPHMMIGSVLPRGIWEIDECIQCVAWAMLSDPEAVKDDIRTGVMRQMDNGAYKMLTAEQRETIVTLMVRSGSRKMRSELRSIMLDQHECWGDADIPIGITRSNGQMKDPDDFDHAVADALDRLWRRGRIARVNRPGGVL